MNGIEFEGRPAARRRPGRDGSLRRVWTFGVLASLCVLAYGCPPAGPGNGGNGGGALDCPTGESVAVATVSYANDIRPIFSMAGCLAAGCHGGSIQSSRYDMRTYESTFRAGDEAMLLDNCPIVPGDPDGSYLVEKISGTPRSGARMPLLGPPLSDEQVGLIRTWIAEGAANN